MRARALGAGVCIGTAIAASMVTVAARQPPRAGSVYKNLQILNDIPADRLGPTMLYIRASLGAQCSDCHVGTEWEKDDKPEKARAREMLRMVMDLNRRSFDEPLKISCYTCHRGRRKPTTAVPPFDAGADAVAVESASALPSVEAILRRYLEGAGGEQAWRRPATRIMRGTLETSEPAVFPLEVYAKAPARFLARFKVGVVFSDTFDGERGWHEDNRGVHDLAGEALETLRGRAQFYGPLMFRDRYRELRVVGRERLAAVEVVVLEGSPLAGAEQRIYFDPRSGLLVRVDAPTATPLGPVPGRTLYEDYRSVDGIMLPFRIVRTDAQYRYTQRFTDIKHNESVSGRSVPKTEAVREVE